MIPHRHDIYAVLQKFFIDFSVIPRPEAAFSPFTIVTCGRYFFFNLGRYSVIISRPIEPTTSPINNTRTLNSSSLLTSLYIIVVFNKKEKVKQKELFPGIS